jgi:hypothetical protein
MADYGIEESERVVFDDEGRTGMNGYFFSLRRLAH